MIMLSAIVLLVSSAAPATTSSMSVDKVEAGSVVTELSYDIRVNKESSLRRTCYNINDARSPVMLQQVAVSTHYSRERYSFKSRGSANFAGDGRAVEVVVMLFSILGEHMKNLRWLDVADAATGSGRQVDGTWYASEHDVEEYLTCIAYVRSARLADGTVWHANRDAVFAQIDKIIPNLQKAVIDPETPKRDPGA